MKRPIRERPGDVEGALLRIGYAQEKKPRTRDVETSDPRHQSRFPPGEAPNRKTELGGRDAEADEGRRGCGKPTDPDDCGRCARRDAGGEASPRARAAAPRRAGRDQAAP